MTEAHSPTLLPLPADPETLIAARDVPRFTGIGLKKAEIARILDRHGLLKRKDPDRRTFRRVPGKVHVTVYALDRAKMRPAPIEVVGGS